MKYIDAEKLIAEIERRKELLTPHKGQGVGLCREVIRQFDSLLSFIDIISHPITKGSIIDEIRTEIERRFLEYNHDSNHHIQAAECASILDFIDSFQQEQSEVELEEFTEKMDAWKARFNHPDDIPIKATMAFTARMFYQYPDLARQWYEQLPKATMD